MKPQPPSEVVAAVCHHYFSSSIFLRGVLYDPVTGEPSEAGNRFLRTFTEGSRKRGKRPRVRHILFHDDEHHLVDASVPAVVRYNEEAAAVSGLPMPPPLSYSVVHGDRFLQIWSQGGVTADNLPAPLSTASSARTPAHGTPLFQPSRLFDTTRQDDTDEAAVLLQLSLGVEPSPKLMGREPDDDDEEHA
ncbi:hypothetical protein DFJ73DRAFT_837712 [Zopfochytrium polystomum]|nr:hypothetical protein DFJ73DRAFT_837712 [Zopfochytrium polystomum]